eukprot:364459-Chlamydomonas_euryale.AAC.6
MVNPSQTSAALLEFIGIGTAKLCISKLTVSADLVACSGARHGHDSIAATGRVPCARRRSLNRVELARWACGAWGSARGRERSSRAG